MAKSTQNAPARSAAINVSFEDGQANALLAAWRGVYHLFNGRADFSITPDGVIAENFTVDAAYDPTQIVSDVSHRNRRLDLFPTYLWVQGEAPESFSTAKEMTQWSVQYLRGALEENSSRTPKYVRDAVANYKAANDFAKKRGPKKKIFRAENLSEIDESTLAGIDPVELAKLQETLARAMAAQATISETSESTNEVATPAS